MLNDRQKEIVERAKVPAAVIAGPGTGKTFTIVKKIISLIKNDGFSPNKILLTSFTKKAANELIKRVEEELKKEDIRADTSNMLIGNFHSLALKFLRQYKSFSRNIFDKMVIDSHMEGYLIEKNIGIFKSIENFDTYIKKMEVGTISSIFSKIVNNLVNLNDLRESDSEKDRLALEIYLKWRDFLDENNLINYQLILKNFYDLLKDPHFGQKIRDRIDYVIIDEYQDTNLIQEEIGFLLLKNKNIMVFGDDDQSLYSFRGASPDNLTNFDKACESHLKTQANFYYLDINYRSNQAIIDGSRIFLESAKSFDNIKKLKSIDKDYNNDSLVRAKANDHENLLKIVKYLNKYINLNQIAFLFPSLKQPYPKKLQAYFEDHGLNVLNKSSKLFFKREEIRLLLYIILGIYSVRPKTRLGSNKDKFKKDQETDFKSYVIEIFDDKNFKEDKDLNLFIKKYKGKNISYTEVLYKSFNIPRLKAILSQKLTRLKAKRELSNIGKFSQILSDFINLQGFDINFYEKSVDLIYGYIFYLFKNQAVEEFDIFETPKDAINFSTIHQSKGLEYEAVFLSGLYDKPRSNRPSFSKGLEDKKPSDYYKNFFRKYYTAMTRAKNLLVILDNSKSYDLIDFQKKLGSSSRLSDLSFKFKEEEKTKPILAYTTDIDLYKTCPLKYKFKRVLKFKKEKNKALDFGTKVHSLAEFVSNNNDKLNLLNELVKNDQRFRQPLRNYIKRDFDVKNTELNLKLDRNFYLLQGNIDLVLNDNSIIDIKTGDIRKESLEAYKNQLLTYYNLFLYNGKEIGNLYLYFIEKDKIIEVEKDDFDIKEIDKIARLIVLEKFEEKTKDKNSCKLCPMKHFCDRPWNTTTM